MTTASVCSWHWCCYLLDLETKRSLDVTMFQRSSTYVMSVKHGFTRVFGGSLVRFFKTHMAVENLLENRSLSRRRSTTRRR